MRVNLYLNEKREKDKIIVDMLNEKYDPQNYIKEILYSIARGNNVVFATMKNDEIIVDNSEEEYEKIIGIDDIQI